MPFQKGHKHGNRFHKGKTGNPNGRPVKLFSEIAGEWQKRGIERATPQRVIEVFEYLLALPDVELREMKASDQIPSLVQIAADEMTGKRKREILNDLLDRAHGKSISRKEITGKDGAALDLLPSISISFRPPTDDVPNESDQKGERQKG